VPRHCIRAYPFILGRRVYLQRIFLKMFCDWGLLLISLTHDVIFQWFWKKTTNDTPVYTLFITDETIKTIEMSYFVCYVGRNFSLFYSQNNKERRNEKEQYNNWYIHCMCPYKRGSIVQYVVKISAHFERWEVPLL
jgi:hypothetical protein